MNENEYTRPLPQSEVARALAAALSAGDAFGALRTLGIDPAAFAGDALTRARA